MKTKPESGFTQSIRVYYEDTDAAGIVYHANYLKFAERARTEWLRGLGFDHEQVSAKFGLFFAVKRLTIDYKKPARLDNELEILTKIAGLGAATLDMEQIIRHKGEILAALEVKIVAVGRQGKAVAWPPQLRQIFRSSLGD